ncbi:MAG: NADP-dependent phosphogluconate dehydrogenase [Paracoccaceae bacterium]
MQRTDLGLIGLGTMGAALALNFAEKGYRIAVANRTPAVAARFAAEAGTLAANIVPTGDLAALVAAIAPPRTIILMVPAGRAVDDQIAALRPLLGEDDLIIDAGNAHFRDTERRIADNPDLAFMGIGVSGGEEGARHGPAIMGGGAQSAWNRVGPMLEAIAARHQGTPCAALMGPGGAGHFVKMVHNGIEYADMQMIAEIYGLMRDGMGMSATEIGAVFQRWNEGPLKSYLVEISAAVASATDPQTGSPMLDVILDVAGQKGTGRWTVIEAQTLGTPVPVIEAAVMARNLSGAAALRNAGVQKFPAAQSRIALSIEDLEDALIAGKILCYAQGFEMLAAASTALEWGLSLPDSARVWRAGCIIRSEMLDHMAEALTLDPGSNLAVSETFSALLRKHERGLRQVVSSAIAGGQGVPALAAAISWFDLIRTPRGTANMLQAQRDFFGAHGFDRIDGLPLHHGPWAAVAH